MIADLFVWGSSEWMPLSVDNPIDYDLILIMGYKELLLDPLLQDALQEQFGNSRKVYISTSGEFANMSISDHNAVATGLKFKGTRIEIKTTNIHNYQDSEDLGKALGEQISLNDELKYILLLTDGAEVNGTSLLKGLSSVIPEQVLISGGMAGDMYDFQSTLTGFQDDIRPGNCISIGFYNSDLKVSHGTYGGWQNFGPLRRVTHSKENVLFEIDGIPALELYKKYLGPYAVELPGSALLFPLSVELQDGNQVVRTILSINEEEGSMTFAGDIPQDSRVRFMRANIDKLVDAASKAAIQARSDTSFSPEWAFCVSCVGRKLVLKHRVDEEIEALKEVLPEGCPISGFYSYGELSPIKQNQECVLHNQTMTITTMSE